MSVLRDKLNLLPVLATLLHLALRGVAVDIVLPGRSNLPLLDWAMRPQLGRLLPALTDPDLDPARFGLFTFWYGQLQHPVVQAGLDLSWIEVAAEREAAPVERAKHFAVKQFQVAGFGRRCRAVDHQAVTL
jgi:hypothetical protein